MRPITRSPVLHCDGLADMLEFSAVAPHIDVGMTAVTNFKYDCVCRDDPSAAVLKSVRAKMLFEARSPSNSLSGSLRETWFRGGRGRTRFVAALWHNRYGFGGTCFASSPDVGASVVAKITSAALSCAANPDDETYITFACNTPFGISYRKCASECPPWADVRSNYPAAKDLDWIMAGDPEDGHGRIIFWSGAAGTGKTYAVRALVDAWRGREFVYVLDTETLFSNAGYFWGLLLEDKEKPKVLVLEDCLDILLKESRASMSGAVSRLLNITEGVLGDGADIYVLITSNESVSEIDAAFSRPGRCLQILDFRALTYQESLAWAKDHSVSLPAKKEYTLAELYAIANAGKPIEKFTPEALGFKGTP